MKLILTIFIFSIFSNALTSKNFSMIIFPFKTIPVPYLIDYRKDQNNDNIEKKTTNNTYNSSTFFDDHYVFKLVTPIKIGEPGQDIISSINIYDDQLLIGELKGLQNHTYLNKYKAGYDYKKSISFLNLSSEKELTGNNSKEFIGEEKIYLYTNINNIKKNKFTSFSKFIFKIDNKVIINENSFYGLNIGLTLSDNYYEINFMKQIHDRNIISKYIISFEYNSYNEGILFIGKLPHEYMPEKYNEENYKSFYSYQPRTMYLTNFIIEFDEIYSIVNYEKNNFVTRIKTNILLNMGVIMGIKEYLEFIEKKFFNEYIKMNICQKYMTNTQSIDNFIIFSCNDNKELYFENFPTLYFNMKSQNLSLELNYNDLFKKIGNKYYFMIVFDKINVGVWRLGKPFFLKYTFVYNGDAKTIGFYSKKNTIETKEENKKITWNIELNILKIIVISLLLLIFISLIVVIAYSLGKKYNLIRKKKANELDDDYDYDSLVHSNSSKDINNLKNQIEKQQVELRDQSKFKK